MASTTQSQDKPNPILVIVFFLVVLLLILAFARCTSDSSASKATTATPMPTNSYNWDNLNTSGDFYSYSLNGKTASTIGVDVSELQGDIDWRAVASDGIDFAIVQIGNRGYTQGGLSLDDYYQQNITGAATAGLKTGVYFFSQAITIDEAEEEADFVVKNLGGRQLDYPIVFDAEPVSGTNARANSLSDSERNAIAQAFCQKIETAGYRAMIYGNSSDLSSYSTDTLTTYPVWYAEYASVPSTSKDFLIWQYTNKGSVNGISTHVDLSIDLSAAR